MKYSVLLGAVLLVMVSCGKEPAVKQDIDDDQGLPTNQLVGVWKVKSHYYQYIDEGGTNTDNGAVVYYSNRFREFTNDGMVYSYNLGTYNQKEYIDSGRYELKDTFNNFIFLDVAEYRAHTDAQGNAYINLQPALTYQVRFFNSFTTIDSYAWIQESAGDTLIKQE